MGRGLGGLGGMTTTILKLLGTVKIFLIAQQIRVATVLGFVLLSQSAYVISWYIIRSSKIQTTTFLL